jgi:sporulation protein YlmC with PRC-barrel domain
MNLVKQSCLAVVGAVLLYAGREALAASPLAGVSTFVLNSQATHIIGETLENTDGEKLGKIKDLLVATPSGEIKYILVSAGGILGVASHTKVVPAAAVSLATTKAGTAWLDMGLARWENAPRLKHTGYGELADVRNAAELQQFYFGAKGKSMAKRMEPTGAVAARPASLGPLRSLSELIGKRVQGPGRERVGTLADLLVDLQGRKPTFAIVWAHRQSRSDYTFAVPYLDLGFDGVRFTTGATSAALERAPRFNAQVWAAPSPNAIYRYQVLDADNTARNARDRDAAALTPVDQSEAESDVQITSRLRHQLIKDDKLTFTAKNVKIITINGYVTLRGPVKHQLEKEIIQHRAETIAGQGKVENLIEVERGD